MSKGEQVFLSFSLNNQVFYLMEFKEYCLSAMDPKDMIFNSGLVRGPGWVLPVAMVALPLVPATTCSWRTA